MSDKEMPAVMVDAIVEKDNKLLLVTRKKDPYKGSPSFPGGKVDLGEKVEEAVKRELQEETNLQIEPIHILGVYSDPGRDPRGHRISVTFIAKVIDGQERAADDAETVMWISSEDHVDLAFDHNKILNDYKQWRKTKGTYWSSKSNIK
jgi:8-oxo-dGTP diphosphatase